MHWGVLSTSLPRSRHVEVQLISKSLCCQRNFFWMGFVPTPARILGHFRLRGPRISSRAYPGYQGQRRCEPCRCASGPTPQRVVCSLLGAETPSHERSAVQCAWREILCCRVILRHRAAWQRDGRVPRVVAILKAEAKGRNWGELKPNARSSKERRRPPPQQRRVAIRAGRHQRVCRRRLRWMSRMQRRLGPF